LGLDAVSIGKLKPNGDDVHINYGLDFPHWD
jgi:hypothetical protein